MFEKSDFCALVKFIYIRFMIDGIGVEVGFDGVEYGWSANVCSENLRISKDNDIIYIYFSTLFFFFFFF